MTIGLIDHNSRVIANQILPKELVEPAILVAKIKGYQSVDEYVVDVIADDLISIREGGQSFREFGEKIAEYLDKNEYLEKRCPSISNPHDTAEEEKKEENKEDDDTADFK